MKKLKQYKIKNGLKNKDLAVMFEVSEPAIHYYLSGNMKPRFKRMILIEKRTGGAVPLDSWK